MNYLDHAASTPVRPQARAALLSAIDAELGNASSVHTAGQRSREIVERAREQIAPLVGAQPRDIVFTSGGTEADNLAVKGLAWAAREHGRHHIVVSAIEHPAVLGPARWLAQAEGFTLTEVAAGRDGVLDPDAVVAAVRDDTAVVSVMAANNELGTIQPIEEICRRLDGRVPVHCDAVQAWLTRGASLNGAGPAAISLSGHKFGAPVGVGILAVRHGLPIEPLLHGGGQDRGLRSGTLAAPLHASLAAAMTEAVDDRHRLVVTASNQIELLWGVLSAIDGVARTGPVDPAGRLVTHLHVTLDGVAGDELLFALDRAGLAVSGGAACGAGAIGGSPVLAACGIEADAALRLSVGWTTTDEQVHDAAEVIAETIARLRAGAAVI